MQYKSVKGISGWGQLGILIAFTALGLILAGVAQFLIAMPLMPSGVPKDKMAEELMKVMMKPENVGAARLSQTLGTFFLLFVPTVLFLLVVHGRNTFWLGFNKYLNFKQVLIGFILIFLANLIAVPFSDITRKLLVNAPSLNDMAAKLEATYSDQVKVLSNLGSWPEFIMAIFIMALLPAIFEEVYFRGVLQNLLSRWWKAPLLAVIVTSLVFSLIHVSIYLFLSRAVLGFILGLMYQRSKNLWVNILAHFINNAIALSQLFYFTMHKRNVDVDKLDPKVSIWAGLIGVAITYGLFIAYERYSQKNRQLIENKEQVLLEGNSLHHSFPEN